jgi:hypothetical protein
MGDNYLAAPKIGAPAAETPDLERPTDFTSISTVTVSPTFFAASLRRNRCLFYVIGIVASE